jgi:hypothetical protein
MIVKAEFHQNRPGLVKVNGYVGRIIGDHTNRKTASRSKVGRIGQERSRRFQKPDWLEYTIASDLWEPTTLQDLLDDAENGEKRAALKSIEAVEKYVGRPNNCVAIKVRNQQKTDGRNTAGVHRRTQKVTV